MEDYSPKKNGKQKKTDQTITTKLIKKIYKKDYVNILEIFLKMIELKKKLC